MSKGEELSTWGKIGRDDPGWIKKRGVEGVVDVVTVEGRITTRFLVKPGEAAAVRTITDVPGRFAERPLAAKALAAELTVSSCGVSNGC